MQRRPAFVPKPEWPLSHGQPRAALGTWPTPVERMDNVSQVVGADVWVKREDRCEAWGGNKVRKLEFWLAHPAVWKARRIIVSGAGSSTWAAAAAYHGRQVGLDVTAALAGPIPDDRQKLFNDLNVHLVHNGTLNALPYAIAKAKLGALGAMRLPMGGSGWPGDLGSYICGVEIVVGSQREHFPRPKRIFVATGTAGTAAGIAAALANAAQDIPTVAVRVAPRPFASRAAVVRRTKGLLKKMPPTPDAIEPRIEGEERFFGKGYGKPGPGIDEAIELAASDGVELERTYTAKAFAALIAHARSGADGPLLFIQTAAGPTPTQVG